MFVPRPHTYELRPGYEYCETSADDKGSEPLRPTEKDLMHENVEVRVMGYHNTWSYPLCCGDQLC